MNDVHRCTLPCRPRTGQNKSLVCVEYHLNNSWSRAEDRPLRNASKYAVQCGKYTVDADAESAVAKVRTYEIESSMNTELK